MPTDWGAQTRCWSKDIDEVNLDFTVGQQFNWFWYMGSSTWRWKKWSVSNQTRTASGKYQGNSHAKFQPILSLLRYIVIWSSHTILLLYTYLFPHQAALIPISTPTPCCSYAHTSSHFMLILHTYILPHHAAPMSIPPHSPCCSYGHTSFYSLLCLCP